MDKRAADPNARTMTLATSKSDELTRDSDDDSRGESAFNETPHSSPEHLDRDSAADVRRLPAPLQYRDPNRYEVIIEHGRGGLGRVVRARDRELGRHVAVKELLAPTKSSELRFFREALITAKLEHPSIVPIHEAGRWPDGTPFYTMKLIAGRALSELINSASTLQQRIALLPNVIAVADAIAYAHSKGIIHRDLKPSNVIVGDFGETIVIDWGLAKPLNEAAPAEVPGDDVAVDGADVTRAGTVLGTPAFMAPEQAMGSATAASDIYSIGIILINILTGRVVDDMTSEALPRGVSQDLRAIVARATAHDPVNRYQAATDLGSDLRAYLGSRRVSARSYGVLARFVLVAGRNKRLTLSTVFFLTLLSFVLAATTASIRSKHRHAVAAQRIASAAEQRANERADDLTLANARLLLAADPTRALGVLENYGGQAHSVASLIAAEAREAGAAKSVIQAHTDIIPSIWEIPNKGILTTGSASALLLTDPDTGDSSKLADDVMVTVAPALAPTADHIAYIRSPGVLIRLQLSNGATREAQIATTSPVRMLAYTRSGTVYAYTADSKLFAWRDDSSQATLSAQIPSALNLFPTSTGVLVVTHKEVFLVDGDRPQQVLSLPHRATTSAYNDPRAELAVGSDDGSVSVIALTRPARAQQLNRCDSKVVRMAYGASGRLAYTCQNGTVHSHSQDESVSFTPKSPIYSLAVADDGTQVIAGCENGNIYSFETSKGELSILRGQVGPIYSLLPPSSMLPHIVSGGSSGELRVWRPKARAGSLVAKFDDELYGLSFSRDGKRLLAGSRSGRLRLWDFVSGACQQVTVHRALVFRTKFSPDETWVASADFEGVLSAWSASTGQLIAMTSIGQTPIADLDILGSTVLAASHDGRLVEWSPWNNTIRNLHVSKLPITGVETITNTETVALRYSDGTVAFLHDAVSLGDRGHAVADTLLKSSPQGRFLAMGSSTGTATIATVPSLATSTLQLKGRIRHVAFTSDEQIVSIAAENGELVIATTRPLLPILSVRDLPARQLTFSPDGRLLIALGEDGVVRILNLKTLTWSVEKLHSGYINTGTISPDSRTLFTGGADGRLMTLPLSDNIAAQQLPRFSSRCTGEPSNEDKPRQ